MFNAQQITARLASMSDQQLAQYARMHKEDPYVLPLTVSEFKRRQQARQQAQANQVPQEQPTVSDQTLQEMLPEQLGIGRLPAPNMDSMDMANGGIVAFDGGGLTEADKEELERRQREELSDFFPSIGRAAGTVGQGILDAGAAVGDRVGKYFEGIQNIPFEKPNAYIKYETPKRTGIATYETSAEKLDRLRQEERSKFRPAQVDESAAETQRLLAQNNRVVPPTDTKKDTATKKDGGTKKELDLKKNVAPPADRPPAAGLSSGKNATLQDTYKMAQQFGDSNELMKRVDQYGTDANTMMDAERIRRENERPKEKAGKKYEDLLKADAEKDKVREGRNFNMALINAGLAIAGGKSQYALQNIAEGAQVGTKQYSEGIAKLEESAKARNKEIALIEEARRAEARGDYEKRNAFEEKAIAARLENKKMGIEALSKIFDTDKKIGADIYNTLQTNASRERVANAQIQSDMKRTGMMYGDGKGAITPALLLKEYNDRIAQDLYGDFKKQYPSFEDYQANMLRSPQAGQTSDGAKFLGIFPKIGP